jgi:hypothetical protein
LHQPAKTELLGNHRLCPAVTLHGAVAIIASFNDRIAAAEGESFRQRFSRRWVCALASLGWVPPSGFLIRAFLGVEI